MSEQWKSIEGYEGLYEVSNLGRVKALARTHRHGHRHPERIMSQSVSRGYPKVELSAADGSRRSIPVHRLVCAAFYDNPEDKRCVNHIDGDKANNHVSNLEWATHSENEKHAYRIGLKASTDKHKRATAESNRRRSRIMEAA